MTVIGQARDVDVHEGTGPLPGGVLRLLEDWLPGRRWYPIPGNGVRHVPWCTVVLASGTTTETDAPADVVVPLLRLTGPGLPDSSDEGALVIQVPLVLRPAGGRPAGGSAGVPPEEPDGEPAEEPGLIGVVDTPAGPVSVYDGGADPAAWRAYLAAALAGRGPEEYTPGPSDAELAEAHPLGGEQSNSSVLVPGLRPPIPGFPGELADGVILKILRTVPLGPHPDVVVPEALTRAGWKGVPRYLGAVELPHENPAEPHDAPVAHLAVVAELITEADDGFELACAHASEGVAFDEQAAALGAAVAHLHAALAVARPTDATLDASGFMGVLRRRAAEAIADVTELAPHRGGITAFYDEVSDRLSAVTAERPIPLQAIHGDLHLGQVLHARDGWKVLDFEGEPQRPVAERTAPDLPLRDVAGLLRSFDYAAAVGEAKDPDWSGDAQLSFLEGYREAAGDAPASSALDVTTASLLLRALTLDKALYETVYESRHRPAWLPIPLTAVSRTLSR
ncbi:aminoglycoside phosphotransferase [Myceligenerans crystallogenes]|uniref:Trehalose biosynthesis protein n=1 Tax=Myceligenerans crystallogenes TaxID=316335 RepID=A0ABN2NNH8_9MICO